MDSRLNDADTFISAVHVSLRPNERCKSNKTRLFE